MTDPKVNRMRLPMDPLLAALLSATSAGGLYMFLRFAMHGTGLGSVIASATWAIFAFGALIVEGDAR